MIGAISLLNVGVAACAPPAITRRVRKTRRAALIVLSSAEGSIRTHRETAGPPSSRPERRPRRRAGPAFAQRFATDRSPRHDHQCGRDTTDHPLAKQPPLLVSPSRHSDWRGPGLYPAAPEIGSRSPAHAASRPEA